MKNYFGIFVVIILLVVLGAIGIASINSAPSYSQNDQNKPVAFVQQKEANLGEMKIEDTKYYDFKISNKGKSDLLLSQISTSCDCTFAKIIKKDGAESPNLTMHSTNSWKTYLKPNESATLRITYKPSIMPVEGPIDRFATVSTNDPNNPKLEFKVSTVVSK